MHGYFFLRLAAICPRLFQRSIDLSTENRLHYSHEDSFICDSAVVPVQRDVKTFHGLDKFVRRFSKLGKPRSWWSGQTKWKLTTWMGSRISRNNPYPRRFKCEPCPSCRRFNLEGRGRFTAIVAQATLAKAEVLRKDQAQSFTEDEKSAPSERSAEDLGPLGGELGDAKLNGKSKGPVTFVLGDFETQKSSRCVCVCMVHSWHTAVWVA